MDVTVAGRPRVMEGELNGDGSDSGWEELSFSQDTATKRPATMQVATIAIRL